MAVFNIKNVELVWRGITLRGFSNTMVSIQQNNETGIGSSKIVMGISGEFFIHPNTNRLWTITSEVHALSLAYPVLIQDNLNSIEDTLIVRDLNNGVCDIYAHCTITQISGSEDGKKITVTWTAVKRNGR